MWRGRSRYLSRYTSGDEKYALGLARGPRERVLDLIGGMNDPEAFAASSGGGLYREGDPVLVRESRHLLGGRDRLRRAGHGCDSGVRGSPARFGLVPHGGDDLGSGTDPGQAGFDHRPSEVGVLGEEAIAGMDRLGSRSTRRVQNGGDLQVRLGWWAATHVVSLIRETRVDGSGVEFGIDGDR